MQNLSIISGKIKRHEKAQVEWPGLLWFGWMEGTKEILQVGGRPGGFFFTESTFLLNS
jgi:hypothetical protein